MNKKLNLRLFFLKLMIISLPLGAIKIYFPQLNLPTFLFFIYLIAAIPVLGKKFNLTYTKKPVVILTLMYIFIFIISFIYFIPGNENGFSVLRQFPIFILFFHFVSKELINGSVTVYQLS